MYYAKPWSFRRAFNRGQEQAQFLPERPGLPYQMPFQHQWTGLDCAEGVIEFSHSGSGVVFAKELFLVSLPTINPVWSKWTATGNKGFNLFASSLLRILMFKFRREMGQKWVHPYHPSGEKTRHFLTNATDLKRLRTTFQIAITYWRAYEIITIGFRFPLILSMNYYIYYSYSMLLISRWE